MSASTLSLAELESFDPHSEARGKERRFCCPLCGGEHRRDKAHRSVAVNIETGAWRCWRCQATGKVKELWTDRPRQSRRALGQARLRRAFALDEPHVAPPSDDPGEWRKQLVGLQALAGTPGETYVRERGISLDAAVTAGVRYSHSFYGRPGVVFPIRSAEGILVGAHCRHSDGRSDPKGHDAGRKSLGVVYGTPGALDSPLVCLVEGPFCALTMASLGLPTVAMMGRALPGWLADRMFRKLVFVGSDVDGPGTAAAAEWTVQLRANGARVVRITPPTGKDWNESLAANPEALAAYVSGLLIGGPRAEVAPTEPTVEGVKELLQPEAAASIVAETREADPTVLSDCSADDDGLLGPVAVASLMAEEHLAPGTPEPDVWPDSLHPAVLWVLAWDPEPTVERIQIAGGVYVTDQVRFAASLRADVLAGPERDRLGAVKARLRGAWEAFGCSA